MKLIYCIACFIAGIMCSLLLAMLIKDDGCHTESTYDEDEDGGYFDDWRLP